MENNVIKLSKGKLVTSKVVKTISKTPDQLLSFLSKPKTLTVTALEYHALSDSEKHNLKREKLTYWSGSVYKKDDKGICKRSKNNVESRQLLTLDIDHADSKSLDAITSTLKSHKIPYIIHSSISHSPQNDSYRYRLVIPCVSLHTASEYEFYINYIETLLGVHLFDKGASKDSARAMFSPVVLSDEDYLVTHDLSPEVFELDAPESLKQDTQNHIRISPTLVGGIEGHFNELYSCPEILFKYGYTQNNGYEPEDPEDPLNPNKRWSYVLGTSRLGIRFYENGKLLHSEHESDPLFQNNINGTYKQWSPFELYAFFAFDNDHERALREISKYPEINKSISEEFDDIDAHIETAVTNTPLQPCAYSEFKDLICCGDAQKTLEFMLRHAFLLSSTSSLYFVIPVATASYKTVYAAHTNEHTVTKDSFIDFKEISIATISKFMGDCGSIVNPANPQKQLSILDYLSKYSKNFRRYFGYDFVPFNPYPKNSKTPVVHVPEDKVNTFFGYNVTPELDYNQDEVSSAAVSTVIDYITDVICQNDHGLTDWVLDWIADIVQNPSDKPGTCLVLYSTARGVGKSTLFILLRSILGALAQNLPHDFLTRKFNHQLAYCLLGFIDDISYQVKKDAATMRTLITSEYRYVEKKGKDGNDMRDCTRYLITSNHKHIVDIDSVNGERRYTIIEMKDKFPIEGSPSSQASRSALSAKKKYFDSLYSTINQYAPAILAYFLQRTIKSDLRYMYKTGIYEDISNDGLSRIDALLDEVRQHDYASLEKLFNDDDGFTEDSVNVGKTTRTQHVAIRKTTLLNYYKDNYDKNITTHGFNKLLNSSQYTQKFDIKYSGKHKGHQITFSFEGNNKGNSQVILLPYDFFHKEIEKDEY
jgi:hypothetical protein